MKKLIMFLGVTVLSLGLMTSCGSATDSDKSPVLEQKENQAIKEAQQQINMCLDELDKVEETYPEFESPFKHAGAAAASAIFAQSAKDTISKLEVDNKDNLLQICDELMLTYELLESEFDKGKNISEINIDDQVNKINSLLEK